MSNSIFHLTAISLLGFLVYSNTFGGPFQFDDIPNISANPVIRDFSFFLNPSKGNDAAILGAFPSRFVGYLTFALNYHLHGLDTSGFHLLNILIHIFSAFFLYILVTLSFRTPRIAQGRQTISPNNIAFMAAVFFVVHPVQTQAVTYIVQRFASLATMFYLGSMACYIKARLNENSTGWIYYAGALALAVFAMKTKEIAFTLPVVISLFEFMFFKAASFKKRALLLLPILLTMLIIPLTLIDFDRPLSEAISGISERTDIQHISRGTYFLTELSVISTYLRLLLLPVNQTLDYDYPLYSSITQGPVLGGLVLILLLISLAIYLYRKKEPAGKLASFSIIFFFLALSVESTLVPLHPIYEHRMYLPMAGASIAIAAGLGYLLSSLQNGSKRKAVIAAIVMLALTLSTISFARNTIWQSRISLWTDAVAKAPGSARALNNLATEYIALGRLDEAGYLLNNAIQMRPGYPEAYNNLGLLFQKRGLYLQAIEYHHEALSLWPDYPEALNNMGVSLDKIGQSTKATSYYERAIRVRPYYQAAYENLGISLGRQGRFQESLESLQKALELDPGSSTTYNNIGNVYYQFGNMQQAEKYYLKALELNDAYIDARINLIRVYVSQASMEKAQTELDRLSHRAPEKAEMLKQQIKSVPKH